MAEKAESGWNIVVVVSDTLRTAYLGAYGNKWVHTPNLDQFAQAGNKSSMSPGEK